VGEHRGLSLAAKKPRADPVSSTVSLASGPHSAERDSRTAGRYWPVLGAILVVAFVVRLIQALHYAPPLGFLDDDTFFYWTARQMAQGHGYVTPLAAFFHKPSLPTAEHPPLFPLFLAGLSKLGVVSVKAQRVFNVIVGTITVLLTSLLARRIAGWRAGLVAAVICAAYPSFIAADGTLMSETLFGALVAGALLQALRWRDTRSLGGGFLLGLLIGLATLTRSEGLLLLPLLVLPVAFHARGRRLLTISVAILGCFVVLAPWLARNWDALGSPVLSDNEGITVAGANCYQTYYGNDIGGFDAGCLAAATRGFPPRANEVTVAAHAQSYGVSYAEHHAGRAIVVAGIRLAAVWGFYSAGRQFVVTGRRVGLQKAGIVIYYLILILAAAGAWALWRSRQRAVLAVLASPFVVTSVTAMLTWGLVRLRQESEISLIVLAGIGVIAIADARTRRSRGPVGSPETAHG
jgi:4-amino-4-deoxy-L-arabinose transferase-like glycosyltransferase